jgi:putative ABC transport system ATP-binding protein
MQKDIIFLKIVEAIDVSKTYRIDNRDISVLRGVSLAVTAGEFVVVKGQSGSGKTTLLSLLSGLDKPTAGRIYVDGRDITDDTEDQLAPMRNQFFGFVFQAFHLVPALNALENVMFPAQLNRDRTAADRARELLRRVGLSPREANFPHQLSGGEMQRVAICRALINHPKIIFADEPTGNLDAENGRSILKLLLEFHRAQRTTLLMVTHNRDIAALSDRIISLDDGRISGVENGKPSNVQAEIHPA